MILIHFNSIEVDGKFLLYFYFLIQRELFILNELKLFSYLCKYNQKYYKLFGEINDELQHK